MFDFLFGFIIIIIIIMVGGSELKSAEGTTQGDPLAMSMYAISLQPLISLLHNRNTAKQCWLADDATGAGPLEEVKQWWDELREAGPPLGYYPNSMKCWLVIKPEKEGPREGNVCRDWYQHHHRGVQTPWRCAGLTILS